MAQHTVRFTNGLGNWWYISNIASHRLTPWMFLLSRQGNPVAFQKESKHSVLLLCSTRIHNAVAAQFSAWMLFCFARMPGPWRSQGVSLQIHTGKEEYFILGGKRPPHVHESLPSVADIYDVSAFPLPFEHYSSHKSMSQGNNSYNEASPKGFWV